MPRPFKTTPLLLSMSLAGCAVGPDYRAPAIATPDRYMGSARVEAREGATPAPARWWTVFGDPVLDRFVEQALAENLDLARSVARIAQARAMLGAATAALLPSGAVQASAGHVRNSLVSPAGAAARAGGFPRDYETYEGDVTASWEIDIFGGLRRRREAAIAEYQASAADAAAARLSVAAQVADTYVAVRGLQARLAVARDQVATQRRLVATVRLQYSKGVAAELQLRQAEGVLAQVAATVPVLDAGLEAAMNALDVLTGAQPGSCRTALAASRPVPAPPALAGIGTPADLLRRRPDLIVAERRLAASNARIGAAIAEYFPKISLTGLLGTASATGTGSLFSGSATQGQGFAGLRWRLFDFGRIDAEIRQAKAANAEALAGYRLAVLRASEDVENAFTALADRREQEATLSGGEHALARARDASRAAYEGGVVSLIEVLDADTRLLQTRDQRAVARTEAARAVVASYRALGGGTGA